MFENLKGMASMATLMRDLPRIKARMEQVKADLARVTVEAETGGGAVKAVANGEMRLVNIKIEPTLIATLIDPSNPEDRAVAEELVIGAVNAALERAKQRAAEELAKVAQELNLPIPAGGLASGLGGLLT